MSLTSTRPMSSLALPIAAAVFAVAFATSSVPAAAANKDVDILTALRKGLQDPNGELKSWNPNLVDPCTWFHVSCDGASRVIRLDLSNLKLSGPLAPELGRLEQLQYMDISKNNIQGHIPSEFGGLRSLVSLDLSGNAISGRIPAELGNIKSLRFLRVNHNRLTGPVPMELDGLPNLGIADFSSNDLCGRIPTGGAFKNIPPSSFANNPRMYHGGKYVPSC